MLNQSHSKVLSKEVAEAKRKLDLARQRRDELSIALAEAALNDLLDRLGEAIGV